MNNAIFKVKEFKNEPILEYNIGSKERQELENKLADLKSQNLEIPLVIGGKEIRTGKTQKCIIPHNKNKSVGYYHVASMAAFTASLTSFSEAT